MKPTFDSTQALRLGRETLQIEAAAVFALAERLQGEMAHQFTHALELLLHCKGRVVVSGMGKSGHVGRKIAATLASTGTPSFFVHPAEASHGDLGMVTQDDVMLAISNSGEGDELLAIVPITKRSGAKIIAFTGKNDSTLARLADAHLNTGVAQEACPLNLAPTASTTAALAMGDALAVALLDARGFNAEDFARSHPGGSLGRKLLTHVRDVMRTGEAIPQVASNASLSEALLEVSRKGMGMTAVVDAQGQVAGIFTDGDLRRLLEKTLDFRLVQLPDVMTVKPRTILPDALAVEAVELMERYKINQLMVVNAAGALVGALNMHDLFAAKVI